MARTTLRIVVVVAQAGFSVLASVAFAEDCTSPVGSLVSVQGLVEVQRAGATDWRQINLGDNLCAGDVLRIGERSRIEASLVNQVKIRGDQNTTLKLISAPEERISWLDLFSGGAYFFSRQPRSLNVNTPFVNAAVEGTEFQIRVAEDHTDIGVFSGAVLARNSFGEAALRSGQSSVATAFTAPTDVLTIRPFDAVQWALYFPPVLASPPADLALPMALREAIELAEQGRTAEAFQRFAEVPDADRDATFYLYRAQTLLSVGRADEAEADLREVLALEPENALAYGVLAIIAVSRNEQAEAVRLAQHAVKLAPSSAAAKIALSYAEQSRFQIEAARDALQQAVADEPENALAWARLSELWLMLGWRDRAVETARRARDLAPDLGRVQTVLGFAALAEINTRRAAEAFRRAIELDQASPLPRFGLGLATIRDGRLREGRADIESAVLLDPNNSLLRSYLGKAYFEERTTNPLEYFRELVENFPNQENKHAAEQYALAKQLDPNDPTPWFYDAIRKQTENRPVEALQDLQKSIELNDNRAVFRSRELLDQDRAARGASLARIYTDLNFEQLGINEATRSLSLDPANASAHRFLSDVYATQPRSEIARASELLQSQLLQDININPVQPSLVETDLNIVTQGGPATPGFNEYNSLFERNRAQLNISGAVGSEWTRGNEAVASAVYDRYSVSAGQFHYQSDGFRQNFDIQHNIYNFFLQAAVTPEFNIQAEGRKRYSEFGDISLNYDISDFLKRKHVDVDETVGRIGARYSPSPNSDIITSFIYTERNATEDNQFEFSSPSFTGIGDSRVRDKSYQPEIQYLLKKDKVNVVIGGNYFNVDTNSKINFPSPTLRSDDSFNIEQKTGYVYGNFSLGDEWLLTAGGSLDDYDELKIHTRNFNPKAGFRWTIGHYIQMRVAAFQAVKPPLVTSQTLQPTQVAGFNQFYDDINGTRSTNFAGGLDVTVADNIYGGIEIIARDLDISVSNTGQTTESNENIARLYAYSALDERWAVSGEILYDRFDSDEPIDNIPDELDTFSVPVTVYYFDASGLFVTGQVAFVDQRIKWSIGREQYQRRENQFFLLNVGAGYRLPQRRGMINVGVKNILNEEFDYKDDTFREFGSRNPQLSPYIPERAFFGQIVLNF